ncbi:MAG: peptidylprolyl isomerase [Nanoarchaeota archaeon]
MAKQKTSRNGQQYAALRKKTIIKRRSPAPYLIITLVLIIIVGGLIVLAKLGKLDFLEKKVGQPGQDQTASGFQELAALVNGEKVTLAELDSQYSSLPETYKQLTTKIDLLNQIIEEKLLLQEVAKNKISVTDDEVTTALDNLLVKNKITRDQLEESLQLQGTTLQEFMEVFKKRLLISKYFNETILKQVRVAEQDSQDYYDMNKDLFVQPEQVNASHILLNTSAEADKIYADVKNGADFEEQARKYSIDPSAQYNGGNLGFFSKGMMVKEFEDAAFALKVGEISKPVKSQFGWHIIKVYDKKESQTIQYEEVKDDILNALEMQKAQDAFDLFLKQLKARSTITVYFNETNATILDSLIFPIENQTEESEVIPEQPAEEETSSESASEEVPAPEEQPEVPAPEETVPEQEEQPAGTFASCLKSKGFILYGAYWSKDTQDQLKLFGDEQSDLLYVECGVQDDYAAQTKECKDAGIDGYPSWKHDGRTELGIQTMERLKALSGC